MRIRKLAKLNAATSSSLTPIPQPHICHFNQSPWDVMTDFSAPSSPIIPLSPKVNGNGLSAINERFDASISLMEWEICDDDVTAQEFACMESDDGGGSMVDEKSGGDDGKTFVLCCKTDGRNWYCKREARNGNKLCEHHLGLLSRKISNISSDKKKKSAAVVEAKGGKKRFRTKKPSTAAANPYKMVYYSGFGPGYGKIRQGEPTADNGNDNNLPTEILEHELPVNEPSSTNVMNEGLDYIEDDDDDDEEDGFDKRKRARKPVKARSLKSLM